MIFPSLATHVVEKLLNNKRMEIGFGFQKKETDKVVHIWVLFGFPRKNLSVFVDSGRSSWYLRDNPI
jgi:hypothetical protein